MQKLSTTAAALVALILATGCQATDSSGTAGGKQLQTDSSTPSQPKSTHTPKPPLVPNPDGKYSSSCDYLLGDFSSFTQSGYRFTADTTLHNTGNIGLVMRVTATWNQAGGQHITRMKTVRLAYKKSMRTGFIVPAGQDQIDQYQGLGYGKNCAVRGAIIDTFGKPHRS